MEVPLPFYAPRAPLLVFFQCRWSHLVMPPIHLAQITAAYLAFSGMHQAPALCFNSREHLQGTSYFLLNGQFAGDTIALPSRVVWGKGQRVLIRRRQVQKKNWWAQEIHATVLLYLLSSECFLVPPGPGRLVLTSSSGSARSPCSLH